MWSGDRQRWQPPQLRTAQWISRCRVYTRRVRSLDKASCELRSAAFIAEYLPLQYACMQTCVLYTYCYGLCYTPFTRYSRLSNRLYNWFDNRLNEQWLFVQQGCQTGCTTGLTTSLTTGCIHGTAVVKPVVKRDWQPVECLYTRYNRLSKRFDNNRFDNRFDNRLYPVNGALKSWLFVHYYTPLPFVTFHGGQSIWHVHSTECFQKN